jgi:hypothetical protein
MLNKNYEILCKLNLAQNNITVNDVIRAVNHELKNAAIQIIGKTIDDIQDGILDRFLGFRWNEFDNKIVPWICPHCNERSSFVRRGTRPRKLKTSEGIIKFNLYQVTCKSCRKTFSPFPQILGLKPRTRISTEFEEKIVKLALNNSYSKTSEYIESFTESTISHTASRNITLRVSDNLSLKHEKNEFDSILIDGTKVKSGFKKRGSEIHLALSPLKRIDKNGRPYTEKTLVAFSIGDADKSLKKQLSKYTCNNVIVDGDPSYANLIKDVFKDATHRRCLWHIPRQLAHLLYTYNVPVKEREAFVKGLASILKIEDFYKAISEYFDFIQMFERLNFKDIVSYLKNAMPGIFHNKDDWNNRKKHSSNSLIEREMREINRRTDIGCRWSDKGVYKMIKLLQINRHATHNFDQYFKQNRRPIINLLQVSLCS